MRETLEFLRPVLAGERGAGGFKLETPPAEPVPIVLAALRGKMLARGVSADGAFTNFLPLSGLPRVTEAVRGGEAAAGREGSVELACRFFCVPRGRGGHGDRGPVRRLRHGARLHRVLPLARLGRAARPDGRGLAGGDRKQALELAPVDLVRDVFIFGTGGAARAAREFTDGGITTPILTFLSGPDQLPGLIDALAP